MEIQIAPETRAALEADAALRFLYKTKFTLDSRHSSSVIAWTENLATSVSSTILKIVGRETASVEVRMNIIHLLNIRNYALFSFDLFLAEGNDGVQTRQPIHEIYKKGNILHVRRNKKMDAHVAAEFMRIQNVDKGPLPYFVDAMHPPVYDNGIRLEEPMNIGEIEKESDLSEDECTGDEEIQGKQVIK